MSEESGIFLSHIHNEAYVEPYLKNRATADGLVTTAGRETESLSGVWHYSPDVYDTALRSRWHAWQERDDGGRPIPPDFDFDAWPTMRLPATWNTVAERLYYYESTVVFTRTFRYVPHGESRVLLRFGAVAYRAIVFLCGRCLGAHDGASTPFVLDATEAIQEENRIIVAVENSRSKFRVPMGHTDWFNYGGIFRDVELLRLPESYITGFSVHLVPDGSYSRIRVAATVSGSGDRAPGGGARDGGPGELRLSIPELRIDTSLQVQDGCADAVLDARPELWSPENPRLYEVSLDYGPDTVRDRIGFRQISVNGHRVELNGSPLFLRGVSQHEESVANGRALTEAEIRENIAVAKEMNCNFMRLAHYPHTERAAQIADEMGMMLWEEIPVYWAIAFDNEATYGDAQNQLRELIRRDRNRASVIIWSVGNENPDTDERLAFMKGLADTARSEDPTRPVSAACLVDHVNNRIADRLADHLDIIGLNEYLGWYDPDFAKLPDLFANSKPDKPVIITEFGGGALAGHHGSEEELFTEENQRAIYRKQVETIGEIAYIAGTSPWILYDFRTPKRTNRFQQGYNRKGLLSPDKKHRKLAFYVMQHYYRELASRGG